MLYEKSVLIQIVAGREGFLATRNVNTFPLGACISLRNASLEDDSFRTGGGAAFVGVSIGGGITILAAIDYWPTVGQQRTVAFCDDGTIRKDDGSGSGWTVLATGLTVGGAVPFFCIGGSETSVKNRKLFYCDGINAPRYLDGDAGTMTTFNPVTQSAADWAGASQPLWFCLHDGFLWAGGCTSTPHTIYRCTARGDHTDFRTATTYSFPVFSGEFERIVAAGSYKGGIVLLKYPLGGYFFDTTSATDSNWKAIHAFEPGASGPANITPVEDDLIWVDPTGGFHAASATQAAGSVRGSDLARRKLGFWMRENVNLQRLNTAQMVYYPDKQVVMLACHSSGGSAKNRCLHLDIARRNDLGERWVWWDRDRNESLFMRKVNGILVPHMGDNVGQIWRLDTVDRAANGAGYTFEWLLKDDDFSSLVKGYLGRKKNLRFIQIEYYPRTSTQHTLTIYRDGAARQTIVLVMTPSGPVLGSVAATLPFMLGPGALALSTRRRLKGQAQRIAVQGVSSDALADISITRILLGLDLSD